MYDQIHGLFYDDTPLTNDEQQNLLIKAGLRSGWNDPEMDIYNDLDPSISRGDKGQRENDTLS